MYCLGIDIGTGGSRALLVDEKGAVKALFTAPHEQMRMEKPLWAEQRPEDWWQTAQKAIQGVLAEAKITGKQVKGVGLSGQMHGLVLLDEDNTVTIKTNNFPANKDFTVRMGKIGTKAIGGVVVATTPSGTGGSFTATYDIPDSLKGLSQIAIRMDASGGFFAFNWFWNSTTS